jgi:hypothetical protein
MKLIPIVLGILMLLLTPSIYAHAQPINICLNNQAGLGAVTPLAITDAIQTQITQDLQQFYLHNRTIRILPPYAPAPKGCWPVTLVSGQLFFRNELVEGYHAYKHTPYAVITTTDTTFNFTVVVSQEILGMLLDPGAVGIEVSDSVEKLSYFKPPGIAVSDFNIPRRYGARDWCGLPVNAGLCH